MYQFNNVFLFLSFFFDLPLSLTDAELADRRNANRLSGTWNGVQSAPGKELSCPLATRAQSSKIKKEVDMLKEPTNQFTNQQPSPLKIRGKKLGEPSSPNHLS